MRSGLILDYVGQLTIVSLGRGDDMGLQRLQAAASQAAGPSQKVPAQQEVQLPVLRVFDPDPANNQHPDAVASSTANAMKGKSGIVTQTEAPPQPNAELLAEIEEESNRLETATPQEILQWAINRFPKFTMATAFGPEGMTIIYMLSKIAPETPIFNLDTGYQFKETLELREEVKRRYGIEVELKRPALDVAQYEEANGGPVYKTDPARCCFDRKLSVLHDAAKGFDAWASAIRRDQSPDRAKAPIVGWDKKFGLFKVSPLANWTKKEVWGLIADEDIPYNPLHDQGYTSVGCWPCTRSVLPGEDERAGRWSGFAKTECGLHSQD